MTKAKRGFLDGYRTYDPAAEGYGAAHTWRAAFHQRMSGDEARTVLRDDAPLSVLNLSDGATWQQIKAAYHAQALRLHPDHAPANGLTDTEATERMKRLNAAYSLLEIEYGKA